MPRALFVLLILYCMPLSAKPTAIEYSRELDALTRGLDSVHPSPWRKQSPQAFRGQLTKNPNILDSYPFGPWLNISKALSGLDPQQQDSVTGINLLQQDIKWHLLPLTFAKFDDGFFVIAADEPFSAYIGRELLSINDKTISRLLDELGQYFPQRDRDWLPQYLRITELLQYLGAGCQVVCKLKLAGDMGIESIEIKSAQLINDTEQQHALKPIYLIEYFKQQKPATERVKMLDQKSLYWDLSDRMLQSTILFNEQLSTAERFMNNQQLDNIVLDLRLISAIDRTLVERFARLVRQIPEQQPHRIIYVIIDRSTKPIVFELLGRLSDIPEVKFIGQSVAVELSHFYDAKRFTMPKTGIAITLATRFNKFLTALPSQQQITPYKVMWNSEDFFNADDTILNAIVDLIEINHP